jgi:hypothetical protein
MYNKLSVIAFLLLLGPGAAAQDSNAAAAGAAFVPAFVPAFAPDSLDKASPFAGEFARVVRHDSIFYIDTAGRYAFDKVTPVDDKDFSTVLAHGRWGVIRNGRWVLHPDYDSIDTRFDVWRLLKDSLRTWCDTNGRLLAPFRFADMGYLDGRFFDVCKAGKWGIYDAQKDSVVIPFLYDDFDYCGGCGAPSDYVLAERNGGWGVLGFDGTVRVPLAYEHEHWNMRSDEWVESFQQQGAPVLINMRTGKVFAAPGSKALWNGRVSVRKNGKYGLVTAEGTPLTAFEYDDIDWSDEGSTDEYNYACVQKGTRYGVIDTHGHVVVPVQQPGYTSAVNDTTFMVNGDKRKTLVDAHGHRLLPAFYREVTRIDTRDRPSCLFQVSAVPGKWALYNRVTRSLTPFVYDDVSDTRIDGFLVTQQGALKGLYNLEGREVIPPRYNDIEAFDGYPGLLQVRQGKRYGLIDTLGRVVLRPVYGNIWGVPDTAFVKVETHDVEGLASLSRGVLLAPRYESLHPLAGNNWLLVCTNGYRLYNSARGTSDTLPFHDVALADAKGWLIVYDTTGAHVYDPSTHRFVGEAYDHIEAFDNRFAIVRKSDKAGLIDTTGRAVVPPLYDVLCKDTTQGLVLVGGDGLFGVLGADGRVVIPVRYKDIMPLEVNLYNTFVSLSFPLLCFDGQRWQYVWPGGRVLPVAIGEANRLPVE